MASSKSAKTIIHDVLLGLLEEQFKEFKDYLADKELETHEVKPIPRGTLEKKDRLEIANLLISRYTENEALRVTHKVLKAKNYMDEADQLDEAASENNYEPPTLR